VKRVRVEPQFVEFVPDVLDEGVVYVSIPYGAIVHRCCCGCGEKVSTPLSPAQWELTYDGEQISLSPSVGNGALPCNSHYFITRNEVRWARPLSKAETSASLRHDNEVVMQHYVPDPAATSSRRPWWRRAVAWVGAILHR
jgi:Family of unknown function (DUF6527)